MENRGGRRAERRARSTKHKLHKNKSMIKLR